MKKAVVRHAIIFILAFGFVPAFGQNVSDEARRHFDRGMAAMEMAKGRADFDAAIKEFEQAARLAPDWPEAFYNLGLAQEGAEKFADAAQSYRQYLRLAPNARDAEEVKSLINKLEYKREQVLTIPNIVDILVSCGTEGWQAYYHDESGALKATRNTNSLGIIRVDDRSVRVPTEVYESSNGKKYSYETLSVAGPIITHTQHAFNINNHTKKYELTGFLTCKYEVVSKTLVKEYVHSTNLRSNVSYDLYWEYRRK